MLDDKNLVIFCVTLIVVVALFKLPDPVTIVNSGLSGLFGVAVGKTLK